MDNNEELIKKADIQKIAEEGAKIYETIRSQYEPDKNGKFLAIDIESRDIYEGSTSSEAVELARKVYPNKVFYVIKIGFSAAETLADEKIVNMQSSLALVSMEGAVNVVSVLISQGMPIIGVSLLRKFGYRLSIDFKYNALSLQK